MPTRLHAHLARPQPDALCFYRRHSHAVLRADELILPRPFVKAADCGSPVLALPPGIEDADSVVLFIPDESDRSLQLLVEVEWLDPRADARADRLLIYHARADNHSIALLRVLDAKWPDAVDHAPEVDPSAFIVPNPFARLEPSLCKRLNADRAALAHMVTSLASFTPFDPLVVGVDPDGLDLRTRTGILRLEFAERVDEPALRAALDAWLAPTA